LKAVYTLISTLIGVLISKQKSFYSVMLTIHHVIYVS